MAAITLDVGANTRRAEREIQRLVSRSYNINLRTRGDQPLGRITGKVNEFTKSLDASNARVIAFGASAGIIFGLQRAFSELLRSTVEVQKSLQDINVILNVSTQQLNKFGSELFNIAKNTGQSFQEVAKAATEFSRQGLGLEETLKRTNEALILSRLSGLDTTKSVEALTAAVNSFASQAVTATEVVNKFANVDAAFAVSSADLAEALQRVGSSAAQSGVSLNELIAIVTSAQQTTARGGAVIGNSFKTIFTRLQRGKVVNLLSSLGISETDESGQLKSTIQLLQDLGKIYDTLGARQQAAVAEQVGGVFQINILKAALADLGKEYSIYSSALNVASNTTDQAIRRNEELNKTYAAQVNALKENARELAAAGGQRLFGPSIDRLVGGTNTLLDGFKESDGQNVGTILGKGILDGIGQFIAGPGLALIGGVLLKLFRDLGKFATGSFSQLLGLNTAATQQRDLQQSISQILANNPKLLDLALKSNQGLNQAANTLLASLQRQTAELQKQSAVAAQISKAFFGAGVRVSGGVPVAPTGRVGKAAGYIPNFANAEIMAAKSEGYNAQRSFEVNNPVLGRITVNNREKTNAIPVGGYPAGSFVVNPNQLAQVNGIPLDPIEKMKNKASGFIPNFKKNSKAPQEITVAGARKYGYLIPSIAPGRLSTPDKPIPSSFITDKVNNIKYLFPPQTAYGPKLAKEAEASNSLENQIYQSVLNRTSSYTKKLAPPGRRISPNDLERGFKSAKGAKGAVLSAIGAAFEVGITTALGYEAARSNTGADFDVRAGKGIDKIQSLFGIGGILKADFKATTGKDSVDSFRKKILREEYGFGGAKKRTGPTNKELRQKGLLSGFKGKAAGYIPNFAAIQAPLQASIKDELASGSKPNEIGVGIDGRLKAPWNELGLGVWSTPNESSLSEGIDMAKKAGINPKTKGKKNRASGFIPNFAIEDPDVQAASATSALAALGTQATAVGFAFQFSKEEYRQALADFKQNTGQAAKGLNKFGIGLQANALALSIAAPILGETLKNVLGQETKAARVGGTAASAAGQIGSFAATGALIAGPGPQAVVGAAIGATLGGLLTYNSIIEELNSNFPELNKAAQKASQELTKFSDVGQRVLTSSSQLSSLISEGASGDKIAKAEETYAKALGDLSTVDQQRLISAQQVGKLQDEYAKILEEKITAERESLQTAAVGKITGAARAEEFSIGNILSSAPRLIGQALLGSRILTGGEENNPVAQYGRGIAEYYSPESPFKFGTSEEKLLRETFVSRLTKGRKDETGLEALNAPENVKKLRGLGREATGEDLKNVLETILEPTAENLTFIEELTNIPENQDANQFINDVIDSLTSGLLEGNQSIITTIANVKKAAEFEKARGEALKESQKELSQTSSEIQKNIAIQNLWRSSLENLSENMRGFFNNLKIEQELTQPRQTLENIIGSDKDPVRRLAAQEGLAGIQEQQRTAISSATINFKENIRGILEKPFQENIDKIIADLGSKGSALDGTPNTIRAGTQEAKDQSKEQFGLLNQTMEQVEGYMAEFVSGQISTQQLLEQSRAALSSVGIDVSRGSQASDNIEKAVAELEVKSIQEQVKAFQQRAKLASETKQAILQSRIEAALGTFGGFEGFMGRPGEQENYIQKITPDLERIEEIRGSPTFRYNNKESRDEQRKQSPELGRAFANVYKELIGQSGGAFRNVIQNSIDRGLQQTGVESRDGKAGASALGGFDDIVQGRAADIEQQLQLAKDQLKVTTDPVLKRDLEGFINEIESLGIDRIAKLQTMQEFGVARQSDFKEVYGEFENQSLERLKEISPELAASLSEAVTFGDPLLAESQVQSGLQTKILETINRAISQSGGETGMVTPIDLEAYANEKDPAKRAAMKAGYLSSGVTPIDIEAYAKEKDPEKREAMKNQYLNAIQPVDMAKAKADKKAAEAQRKALPKDNRTIAEIEAETTAKRDQKYLQSPLAPLNRTTGKKFESIEQVDAEMQKALAFGAINPEQKEYYNVLKNFKRNLDPTGGASGRNAMFMLDDASRPIDPNSPLEIEKRTMKERDQRLMGIQNPQGILTPNLSLGPNTSIGEQDIQAQIQSAIKPLIDLGSNLRSLTEIKNDVTSASYDMDVKRKGLYEGDLGRVVEQRKLQENPLLTLKPQNITTQGGQPINNQLNQESFIQQEAAFNNNTSALTSLAGGIESLNSTLSNFETNFGNLNNVSNAQPAGTQAQAGAQAGAQPNVTTTTNAPVNVVVNAQGSNDIAVAVGEAIKNEIPNIVDRVRVALGPPFNKVTPKLP